MRCEGFDRVPLGSTRKKTPEGYLLASGIIAVADNVQPYLARELKLKGVPPDKIVRIYRPKEEVMKSAKGYDGVPLTLEHPSKMVDASLYRHVNRGVVLNTHADDATGDLNSDLLVRDKDAVASIESGKTKELSAAYDFELTMTPGVSPRGEAYDGIATDFAPNHVAITGRARGRTSDGRVCHVADSNTGEKIMRRLVFDAAILGGLTGLSIDLEDPVAEQVDGTIRSLVAQRNEARDSADALLTETTQRLEQMQAEHKTAMDELQAAIPAFIEKEASARASLLTGATTIGVKLVVEGKDTDTLRRELLTEAAKNPERKKIMDAMIPDLSKADSSSLTMAANAVIAMGDSPAKKKVSGHDSLGSALAGKKTPTVVNDSETKPSGRDAMTTASSTAWKRGK